MRLTTSLQLALCLFAPAALAQVQDLDVAASSVLLLEAGASNSASDMAPRCAAGDAPLRIHNPHTKPYGRSYADWSASWWQWAFSLPPDQNPILDPTGDACMLGQNGPVWFLAGTFGGSTTRSCAVPCDRAIFLPIANCEWENGWVGAPVLTIDELRAICSFNDDETELTLEIDGVAIPDLHDFRVQSDLFAYNFPASNIGGQPAGVYFPTISDGYWVMLDPLPPGSHTVHFTVSTPFFSLDVTYDLEVTALALPCTGAGCP